MNVYLRLFRLPGVRRQTVAASLSRMTQPLLTLPLLVGIGEAYDDHALAALTVGLYTAAFALMMPITGRLVDRHGARMILRLWLGFALTALIGTAAAVTLRAPVPIVIIAVVLLGACLPPVGVVTRAGWPILVPTTQLRAAYALDSVITEASMITGPLLAAAALSIMPAPVTIMVAVLPIVAGSLGLPPRVLARTETVAERRATTHRGRLALLCLIALAGSMGAGGIVATAGLLATDTGVPGLAGVLLAAVAVGAVTAGALAGRRDGSAGVLGRRLVGYSVCVAALLLVLTLALRPGERPAATVLGMIAIACAYLIFGCLTGPRDALVQVSVVREVPAEDRGTAFSWLGTSGLLGFGLGSAASGLTGAVLGLPFLAAVIGAVIAVVLSAALLRGRSHGTRSGPVEASGPGIRPPVAGAARDTP